MNGAICRYGLLTAVTFGAISTKNSLISASIIVSLISPRTNSGLKGKPTILVGEYHYHADQNTVPFVGAVSLRSDGVTTKIGITSYPEPNTPTILAVAWIMVGDKKFNATGDFYNTPGSSSTPTGTDTWTNVSCLLSVFKKVE